MGISKIVGITATATLSLFIYLRGRLSPLLLFPLLHGSMVGFLAAIIAHPIVNLPLLFAKSTDGKFPWWSLVLFYPYLIPLRVYVGIRRLKSKEPVHNEVAPQLYVGGWPSSASDIPPGEPAVVDCTCELPKSPCVANLPYMCIPTWDSRAPRPQDIDVAVRWAAGKRSQNRPIFVHCAFGHGRSVAVMCALLVTLGLAEDWKDAEKIIKKSRPSIRMNTMQKQSLEEWSKIRFSTGRKSWPSIGSLLLWSETSNGDKQKTWSRYFFISVDIFLRRKKCL